MMKRLLLAGASFSVLFGTAVAVTPALAEEAPAGTLVPGLQVAQMPPMAPVMSWTGFYVGVNGGWVGSNRDRVVNTGTDAGAGAVVGGGTSGGGGASTALGAGCAASATGAGAAATGHSCRLPISSPSQKTWDSSFLSHALSCARRCARPLSGSAHPRRCTTSSCT